MKIGSSSSFWLETPKERSFSREEMGITLTPPWVSPETKCSKSNYSALLGWNETWVVYLARVCVCMCVCVYICMCVYICVCVCDEGGRRWRDSSYILNLFPYHFFSFLLPLSLPSFFLHPLPSSLSFFFFSPSSFPSFPSLWLRPSKSERVICKKKKKRLIGFLTLHFLEICGGGRGGGGGGGGGRKGGL